MRLFLPADAPTWLKAFADSIERLFRQKLRDVLRLWSAPAADLPAADETNKGAIAYDETLNGLVVSNGASFTIRITNLCDVRTLRRQLASRLASLAS